MSFMLACRHRIRLSFAQGIKDVHVDVDVDAPRKLAEAKG